MRLSRRNSAVSTAARVSGAWGFVEWVVVTIYLDHAATTPVRPQVARTYLEAGEHIGNPSSLHSAGRDARRVLEEARELLAARLGAHPTEVLFTSGGTEADNLALMGLWHGVSAASPRRGIVTSAVEHPAILDTAHALAEAQQAPLHLAAVDEDCLVDVGALEEHLAGTGTDTAVMSVMWANNETGTCQPVTEVAALARRHGIAVHSDAVQAIGTTEVDFGASDLDALSMSGHKIGAPVGIGALIARRDAPLAAVQHGGGQERDVRSGTVPVAGAVALAHAVDLAVTERQENEARYRVLTDRLIEGVLGHVPGAVLRGAPEKRLASHVLFTIEGTDAEAVLFGLDMAGIAAASGAACRAGVNQPSHVLEAMGLDEAASRSGLRLTLGHTSTHSDIDTLLQVLPDVVTRARAAYARRTGNRVQVEA